MSTTTLPNESRLSPPLVESPAAEVLFLDDESSVLNAVRRIFRGQEGLVCHFAASPREALEILTRQAIDVIVSDHRMPQMTGAEFLARVKEKRPNAVRMMLTGQADLAAVQTAINSGEIYRFLLKPWKDEELVQTVRQAVEYGRLRKENERLQALTQNQNRQLTEINTGLEEQVRARTSQLSDALYTAQTLNGQLEDALYGSTKALFSLIQLARPDLGSHCRRVAEGAVAIGRAIGLSATELRDVEIAGLLHDAGKLHLPSFIAEKNPADFSREELDLYKSHPAVGADYIRSIKYFEKVAPLIQMHHERYDGSGFPVGIKRTDVPIGAYVIGISDEYDHLIARPARSEEFAYQHTCQTIADMSDKAFPALIVQPTLDYIAAINDRRATDRILRVGANDLMPNFSLARDLYTMSGSLLAAGGTCLTAQKIARIRAIAKIDPIAGEIWIVRENARSGSGKK